MLGCLEIVEYSFKEVYYDMFIPGTRYHTYVCTTRYHIYVCEMNLVCAYHTVVYPIQHVCLS